MTVIPIGTVVLLRDDIPGIIVGISIRGQDRVTYEVAWWNERSYQTEWFNEFQFRVDGDGDSSESIGFKKEGEK